MKHRYHYAVALAIGLFASSPLWATGKHTCANGAKDWPKCTPVVVPPPPPPPAPPTVPAKPVITANFHSEQNPHITTSSDAVAKATAEATAAVTGSGNSSATGGTGGSVSDSSSWSSRMYVLPAPVFTPPLPKVECPQASVSQKAFAAGWSFISYADGGVNTDNCTAIIVYNQYLDTCQYGSAHGIMKRLEQRVLPGGNATPNAGFIDLTKRECDLLRLPIVTPPAAPTNLVATLVAAPAAVCPAAPKKGPAKRTAKATKPAADCLKPKADRN